MGDERGEHLFAGRADKLFVLRSRVRMASLSEQLRQHLEVQRLAIDQHAIHVKDDGIKPAHRRSESFSPPRSE